MADNAENAIPQHIRQTIADLYCLGRTYAEAARVCTGLKTADVLWNKGQTRYRMADHLETTFNRISRNKQTPSA